MELKNPQTWQYGHANFGANKTEVHIQDVPTDEATLLLNVKAPDGRLGSAQIQFQNNGNVVLRVHLDPANPIHVLIVNGSGILLEA
jgi:hypothetical protein